MTNASASLHLTGGRPVTFRSSAAVLRSFCPTCGRSLFYASDAHGEEIDVTIASLDDPDAVPPKDHVQAASRPSWVALCDGLPAHPGSRGPIPPQ